MKVAGSDEIMPTYSVEVGEESFDEFRVKISGRFCVENAELIRRDIADLIEKERLKNLVLDLGDVEYFDSAAAAVIAELNLKCREMNNLLRLARVTPQAKSLVQKINLEQPDDAHLLRPRSQPGIVIQMGEGAQEVGEAAKDIITFIGASVVALVKDFSAPGKIKWDSAWKILERSGPDAVPIVSILGFLMGAILAFQAAIQLRKFGANIFVADLVSVATCVEMGPLMTAIIASGRSGAAYAAHIGTMQVTEEVDALRVMGIDPIRYLVAPRVLALALMLPCLTIVADILGTLGGCLVSAFALDLTPVTYINQVHKILEVSDVMKGLTKSFVFGIEIALIGCLKGFQVRGGAEGVGTATTSAVVTCVFVLTVTDAVFAMLFHYLRFV